MTLPIEAERGITFAQAGIDISRCRNSGKVCFIHCPQCSDARKPGKSPELGVNLADGSWYCNHCGWGSGLLAARKEQNWPNATQPRGAMVQTQAKAKPVIKSATPATFELPAGIEQDALDFLRDRGITAQAAKAFDLRSHGGNLHMPYYVDGVLVNVKKRKIATKDYRMIEGADKSLFNVDAAEGAVKAGRPLVFCEGELDVIACAVAGWDAVTTPNGAPGRHENKTTGEITIASMGAKLDALNEAKAAAVLDAARHIVIATDNDLEGRAMADALIERLNPAKCWRVEWPQGCKDANDVLQQHGAPRLDAVLAAAKPMDLPGITDFMSELPALLQIHANGYDQGVSTGFPEFDKKWRPRLGTMNFVTGCPSAGKTTLMMDVLSRLALNHGWKVAVFSPESGDTGQLFANLVQVAAEAPILPGTDEHMTKQVLMTHAHWVNDHFIRIDATESADGKGMGLVNLDELIRRIEAAVLRKGIRVVYVDPWNRLESAKPAGMNETEYIAYAINALHRLALRLQLLFIMVAHPTKMVDDEEMPKMYDISGSAHWANMADVILAVQRNKFREPLNRTTVRVVKHRFEGQSGNLGDTFFYLDGRSRRFYCDPEQIPMNTGTTPYVELPSSTSA